MLTQHSRSSISFDAGHTALRGACLHGVPPSGAPLFLSRTPGVALIRPMLLVSVYISNPPPSTFPTRIIAINHTLIYLVIARCCLSHQKASSTRAGTALNWFSP